MQGGFFVLGGFFRSFAELVDCSSGINQALFACEERVAVRADFSVNLRFSRANDKSITASAGNFRSYIILGVD
jgi:hypothetical protein